MPDDALFENLSHDWTNDSSRIFHTTAPQIKNSFLYIQEAGYFKTYPTYFAERANLQSFLILLTLSGKGSLQYQDHVYTITPGQLFWIDCTVHHRYAYFSEACTNDAINEAGSDEGWEFLWLHYYGNGAMDFYTLYMDESSSPVVDLTGRSAEIENILRRLVDLATQLGIQADIEASGRIHLLLSDLLLARMNTSASIIPEHISHILSYLDQAYAQPISLDDLSQRFGISKYYLSREFSKAMGCTLWDYLTSVRISRSKDLLRNTRKPVHEIASLCGFNQSPYFIKTFRKREGITPLAYRKLWQ